ncbi:SusC/RagA family TonB-linked outer membrane protein [Deminuibacter soli]|uniref:TonB-dependent receptor n=1 Tax=Deminuibacter soli TaxID=2291815 RepID=A0A3E1NJW2_9BACT|nr:TonB-dependent receptor [Deminuibacter soli]RFM28213.1 TonB-dependent receptor [Deminuibacter soli]
MTKKRLLLKLMLSALLLILLRTGATAQTKTITGKITDETGAPLPNVSVMVKGTKTGTNTNATGNFSISVPASANWLVLSYVGYETMETNIHTATNVTAQLTASKTNLDAVVVIGYGTQKRKDVTGAVASVKGDEIKNLPVTSVQDALQGRMAGVEVTKSSGAPDAPASILIRGVSSLNNAPPLYIVDGVRQSGDNINIQDIATIDVLKDASAASIYGSAAAGGVIIITTKKGLGGAPTVNFNARYGLTKPQTLQLLNRDDFVKLKRMLDPTYLANVRIDSLSDTDWGKELFRNATEENYNLSISGSTPATNYYASAFYNGQKGVYLNNASYLSGARVNTDFKLGNHIKIGEQLYAWTRTTFPSIVTPINPPFRSIPIMPVYDTTDPKSPWGKSPVGFGGPNLVGQIKTAHITNTKFNLQGNAFAEVKLPLYLTGRVNFGYTYYTENQSYFQDAYNFGQVATTVNQLQKYNITTPTVMFNYSLSFDHTFGDHSINAVVGYEQFRTRYNAQYATETGVGGQSYSFIQTSASQATVSGSYDPNGLIKSTFARLNYNYGGKYYLSGAIRRDGNFTVFGPGNQHGVFPSGSAGWRISEEPFFRSLLPAVSQLKLRGSYGVLGNSNIPGYLFLSTYDNAGAQNFTPDGASPYVGITQNFISNNNIKWESVYEGNVAIDAELLKSKLFFTIEWYNKTTKNMLYGLPIPSSSGIGTPFYTNIGSVRNRGLEIVLGYRDHAGDFNYSISVNGAFNKNKVLNLDNVNNNPILAGDNNYGNSTFGMMVNQPITITKAGYGFGQFYGYKVLGIYQNADEIAKHPQQSGYTARPGDLIFADVNDDGKINDQDRTVIGNPNPKLVYGSTINLSYKGFDVAMLFSGVAGVDLFNGVKAYAQFPFADGNTTSQVFNASFLGSNQVTSQPRIDNNDPNGNYAKSSSYFVESGSYLKMKNLQIGYTFTGNWMKKLSVKAARLYVMGNNLFTITKYSGIDPELAGPVTSRGIDATWQYPHARIYSAGLDITF